MQDFYCNNLAADVFYGLIDLTADAGANFSLNLISSDFVYFVWTGFDKHQLRTVFWTVELVSAESSVAYQAQSAGIVWRIKLVHFVT